MVKLRQDNPSIFQIDEKILGFPKYTASFNSCCSMIHDYSYQYYDMTTEEYLEKLVTEVDSENQRYSDYEHKRLQILNDRLKFTLDKVIEVENDFTVQEKALFGARIRPVVENMLSKLNDIPENINNASLKELW